MAVPTIAETQEDHQASSSSPTSTTVVFGTAPAGDQLILITCFWDGTPGVVVAPSELTFTTVVNSVNTATNDCHVAQFWAVGDGVTNSFAISWDDVEGCWCGSMVIDGADLTTPVDVSLGYVTDADFDSTHPTPSGAGLTTTVDDCLVLRAVGLHSLDPLSSPSNGQIEVFNADSGAHSTNDVTAAMTWEAVASAGALATENFVGTTGRHWTAVTTAIAPPANPVAPGATTVSVTAGTVNVAQPSTQNLTLGRGGYREARQFEFAGPTVTASSGGISAEVTVTTPGTRPTLASQVGWVGAGKTEGQLTDDQTGVYTISTNGTTYEYLDVSGKIRITGNNNTLRFGRVVASAAVNNDSGVIEITGSGNVIEDFEIMASADLSAGTPRTANGVWCNADSPFTLRRCYIAGAKSDAIKVNTNGGTTLIEGCLAEERYAFAIGAHADGIQSQQGGGALHIINSTFEWGIPVGYDINDVPGTVTQGQALWLQNDVDTPKAFTELIISGTRAVSTSMTVGLGGVTSATTRVHVCDNEFEADSGWNEIHPGGVANFTPQNLAWSGNTNDAAESIGVPNGQTPNESC